MLREDPPEPGFNTMNTRKTVSPSPHLNEHMQIQGPKQVALYSSDPPMKTTVFQGTNNRGYNMRGPPPSRPPPPYLDGNSQPYPRKEPSWKFAS